MKQNETFNLKKSLLNAFNDVDLHKVWIEIEIKYV